ncbi:MAG: hypothetical protein ABSF78_01500 [Candidatus Acidiferrales bacterium]
MKPGIFAKEVAALFFLLMVVFSAARLGGAPARQDAAKSAPPLDYEVFKARIEPIFLKNRPGHSRCYSCHGSGNGPQYLVPLSPGSTTWNEEQSRQVFENVSKLVDRDNPANSKLLLRPLSPLAGGDLVWEHSGGRQFESKDDPDWQAMAAWAGAGK